MAGSEVLIEYPDGAQYSCASPAIAKRAHPGAKIVRYFDGRPYEEKQPATRSTGTRPSRRKQATPAVPDSVPAPVTDGPASPGQEDGGDGAADQA